MATNCEFHISWIKRRHGIVEVQGHIYEGDFVGPNFVRSARIETAVVLALPDQAADQAILARLRVELARASGLPPIPEQAVGPP